MRIRTCLGFQPPARRLQGGIWRTETLSETFLYGGMAVFVCLRINGAIARIINDSHTKFHVLSVVFYLLVHRYIPLCIHIDINFVSYLCRPDKNTRLSLSFSSVSLWSLSSIMRNEYNLPPLLIHGVLKSVLVGALIGSRE